MLKTLNTGNQPEKENNGWNLTENCQKNQNGNVKNNKPSI